jgi:transcriptional regulator with XRE-family HTH domain
MEIHGETLGQFLKREREARNIAIDEVEKITKYHRTRIDALEGDHHDQLPSPPYVKGMLRSLAKYYGLDITDLLIRYEDFLNSQKKEAPLPPMEEIRIPLYKKKYFLVSLFSIAFLVSTIAAFFLIRRSIFVPVVPPPSTVGLPSPTAQPVPVSDKKYRVWLKASQAVWIKVQIDAEPPYHFNLKEGGSIQLNGNKAVRFFVSDATALKLTYNDKEVREIPSGPATFVFPETSLGRKEEEAGK